MRWLERLLGRKKDEFDQETTTVRIFGFGDEEPPRHVQNFVECISDHLESTKQQYPQLKPFVQEYLAATPILARIAALAAEKMTLTQKDGEEHSVALYENQVCYLICTLPDRLDNARDWFVHRYGGYSQLLKKLWNSPDFQRRNPVAFCHIFYGWTGESTWTHLTIIPVKQPSPAAMTVLPLEFLTEEERRLI